MWVRAREGVKGGAREACGSTTAVLVPATVCCVGGRHLCTRHVWGCYSSTCTAPTRHFQRIRPTPGPNPHPVPQGILNIGRAVYQGALRQCYPPDGCGVKKAQPSAAAVQQQQAGAGAAPAPGASPVVTQP